GDDFPAGDDMRQGERGHGERLAGSGGLCPHRQLAAVQTQTPANGLNANEIICPAKLTMPSSSADSLSRQTSQLVALCMFFLMLMFEPRFPIHDRWLYKMRTSHNEYQEVSWSLICTTRLYYFVSGSAAKNRDEHSRRN